MKTASKPRLSEVIVERPKKWEDNNNKFECLCRITGLQYYGTVVNGVLLTTKIYIKRKLCIEL